MLATHQHADVYNLMGFSLRKTGDYKQAYTFYRKALDFNPEHKGALEYLGELYVETGQVEKARENVVLLKKLCPGGCEELEDLEQAIAAAPKSNAAQGQLRHAMWPARMDAAAALVGRILLSAIFLHEAYAKLTAYGPSQAYMRAFGVPGELLPLAIAVELGCGLLVVVGLSDADRRRCCLRDSARHGDAVPYQARRPQSAPAFGKGFGDRGWLFGAVRAWRRCLGARCTERSQQHGYDRSQ